MRGLVSLSSIRFESAPSLIREGSIPFSQGRWEEVQDVGLRF